MTSFTVHLERTLILNKNKDKINVGQVCLCDNLYNVELRGSVLLTRPDRLSTDRQVALVATASTGCAIATISRSAIVQNRGG